MWPQPSLNPSLKGREVEAIASSIRTYPSLSVLSVVAPLPLRPHDGRAAQAAHEMPHLQHAQRGEDLRGRQAGGGDDLVDRRRVDVHRVEHLLLQFVEQ